MKYNRTSFDVLCLGSEVYLVHCTEKLSGLSRVFTLKGVEVFVSSWPVWTAAQRQGCEFGVFGALPQQGRAALRAVFQDELDRYGHPGAF